MIEVKPLGTKLYVKVFRETQTKSGLVIVHKKEEWQDETLQALICEVGSGCSYPELKPGVIVIVPGHAGKWIDPELTPDSDAVYRMIDQEEVVAYIEEVQDGNTDAPSVNNVEAAD